MSDELKRCPFCGNKPFIIQVDYDTGDWWWEITCDGCGLSIGYDNINDKQHLIDAWNKRSDGYHTFDELYEHRNLLFINYCLERIGASWIKISQDYPGYFCLYTGTPHGQVSYHIPNKYRYLVEGIIPERPREWDGHTSDDVIQRLLKRAEDCH